MPRIKKITRNDTRKSVSTQTLENDSNSEITHLQEQVRLLKLENDTLKKYDNSDEQYPSTPRLIRQNAVTDISKELSQSTLKKSTKQLKGCTCKSKCSSKQCGCVKKGQICDKTCKCNNEICQNQEPRDVELNKENISIIHNISIDLKHKKENMHLNNSEDQSSLFSLKDIESKDTNQSVKCCPHCKQKLTHDLEEEKYNDNGIQKAQTKKITKKEKKKDNKKVANESTSTVDKVSLNAKKIERNENSIILEDDLKNTVQNLKSEYKKDLLVEKIVDTSFDPMKPKHQLPRTPPRTSTENTLQNVSDINVSYVKYEQVHEETIPEEFQKEEVDLEKLKEQLVECSKCKRNFYLWRIQRHEACCHKV